jgi:hypothetical protein
MDSIYLEGRHRFNMVAVRSAIFDGPGYAIVKGPRKPCATGSKTAPPRGQALAPWPASRPSSARPASSRPTVTRLHADGWEVYAPEGRRGADRDLGTVFLRRSRRL